MSTYVTFDYNVIEDDGVMWVNDDFGVCLLLMIYNLLILVLKLILVFLQVSTTFMFPCLLRILKFQVIFLVAHTL